MVTTLFSYEEMAANGGFTHRVDITFADFATTGALTLAIPLSANLANLGCFRVAARVKTAFVGCATLAITVGDGNAVARYLASADMKAVAGTWYAINTATTCPFVIVGATADTVDVVFTATTNNLNVLSAGACEIYLCLVDFNKLMLP
jgi:hypothetical protein